MLIHHTIKGPVAQPGRAPALQAGGLGFENNYLRNKYLSKVPTGPFILINHKN